MIVVDVNLLIYAHNAGAPQHGRARDWVEANVFQHRSSADSVGGGSRFLRLTTSGPFMTAPFTSDEATRIVELWFAAPVVQPLEPGPGYWPILRELIVKHDVRGSLVSDAHLAALAIEHDATLYTADGDFRRFSGLRVINPLRA